MKKCISFGFRRLREATPQSFMPELRCLGRKVSLISNFWFHFLDFCFAFGDRLFSVRGHFSKDLLSSAFDDLQTVCLCSFFELGIAFMLSNIHKAL